jgi:hypothetical protein
MMKLLKIVFVLVVLVVVLLVAGGVLLVMKVNDLARKGIEQGSSYALGVPTTLEGVSLGIFSGQFGMTGLNVGNPSGYASPHFLKLGSGNVAVNLQTLNQPVVTVPVLAMSDIDVRLERKGGVGNYQAILDNLKKVTGSGSGSGGGGAPSGPAGDEKKLVVNELTIKNVKVHLDMLGADGAVGQVLNSATKITIPIDEIKLQNVGKTGTGVGGTGVTMSQLSSIIVQAVLGAAADKGGGLIPGDVLGDLQGRLTSLGGLKDLAPAVIGGAAGTIEQVGKQAVEGAGKAVEGAAKEGAKALDNIGKGLGGLIPGKKEEPKKGG